MIFTDIEPGFIIVYILFNIMPVPHRRKSQGILSIVKSPMMLTKVFDINFMFEKSKTLLLWGFTPAVVLSGMLTEPAPASWFELINIW